MLHVQRYQGLETLPQAYQQVFTQAGAQQVFLSLPWFQNFVQHIVPQEDTVLIYGVEPSGAPEAPLGALLLWQPSARRRLLTPTTCRSLANYYTAYFAPALVYDCDDLPAVTEAFASALWTDRQGWDVLDLRPLDPQAPLFTLLVEALRARGMMVQTYFCFGNWYLEVAGRSYEEYCKGLPSVLRKNIPYMTRKLQKTARVRLEVLTESTHLDAAMDDYETVYRASWRDAESHPDFLRGLARLAMDHGWLRLGLLYVDDVPAAAQFWLVQNDTASIYKICYDERYAKMSLGTILTAHVMQYVLDTDKVATVDYLSGDDTYKKDWMSHRRERWGIMAFNPRSVPGLLQAGKHIGGRALKQAWYSMTR